MPSCDGIPLFLLKKSGIPAQGRDDTECVVVFCTLVFIGQHAYTMGRGEQVGNANEKFHENVTFLGGVWG